MPDRLRFLLVAALVTTLAACDRDETLQPTADLDDSDQSLIFSGATHQVGGPLPGLSREERRVFARGQALFVRVFTPETGLGPLFNSNACATCHDGGGVGGFGEEIETHATLWDGATCEPFEEINGGSVVQDSVTPLLRAAGIPKELPPPGTQLGRRTTPDLFGFGLLEAVDEDELRRRADPDDHNGDGISGRLNLGEEGEIGRFGRKGGIPDLLDFITDAFIYEQGITSPDEAEEETLADQPGFLPPGVDPTPDPELTEEQVEDVVNFVRFLAPPAPVYGGREAAQGRFLFDRIGCDNCHVPVLRTGDSDVRALRHRVVVAYTDLLIHDMGPALADICNGEAEPAEFRTEPLMGLRFSTLFLHDGRARTIQEAIALHGGEATSARNRFARLSFRERRAVLRFLSRL